MGASHPSPDVKTKRGCPLRLLKERGGGGGRGEPCPARPARRSTEVRAGAAGGAGAPERSGRAGRRAERRRCPGPSGADPPGSRRTLRKRRPGGDPPLPETGRGSFRVLAGVTGDNE